MGGYYPSVKVKWIVTSTTSRAVLSSFIIATVEKLGAEIEMGLLNQCNCCPLPTSVQLASNHFGVFSLTFKLNWKSLHKNNKQNNKQLYIFQQHNHCKLQWKKLFFFCVYLPGDVPSDVIMHTKYLHNAHTQISLLTADISILYCTHTLGCVYFYLWITFLFVFSFQISTDFSCTQFMYSISGFVIQNDNNDDFDIF